MPRPAPAPAPPEAPPQPPPRRVPDTGPAPRRPRPRPRGRSARPCCPPPGPDITNGPRTREEVALTFHGQGPATLTEAGPRRVPGGRSGDHRLRGGHLAGGQPGPGPGHRGCRARAGQPHLEPPADAAARRGARPAGRSQRGRCRPAGGGGQRPAAGSGPRAPRTARPRSGPRPAAAGYQRCISYDVDPQDYRDPGAAPCRTRTRRHARPGSIVSLHLGHPGTVQRCPGSCPACRPPDCGRSR